jgi:hypothetical protein
MAEDQKLIEATVAPGRTVTVGKKDLGPGKKVSLPADEVETLRARGFLVDPNAAEIPRADGPSFRPKEGFSIKVAA